MTAIESLLEQLRQGEGFGKALRHHAVLPAREASGVAPLPPGSAPLATILEHRGIHSLYGHQRRALERLEAGADVVLATPTASGKTLVYHLPVLRRAMQDPRARSLFVFPLKALEQDQHRRLTEDLAALGAAGAEIRAEIYDGDTPQSRRKQLRANPPQVLITTPDMLHRGILPYHGNWRELFANLQLVVLDELHTYRGIFGSHVAQVLRRLDRIAAFHGSRPQFVAASATIANPAELALALTGRTFDVVEQDGSPKPKRHVLLFQPHGSANTLATRIFRLSVGLGLRTIAFTKARVITELMHSWICEAEPQLATRISSYRAGFLPEERREIERQLFSGDLLGVISTSALEAGIDVGNLDVCILVGYPGSQIAAWQRGGRVGRSREAAIVLVAQQDALDQYLVAHPDVFLARRFEHAVTDPVNREVAAAHLPCAAAELPLSEKEPWLSDAAVSGIVETLEQDGALLRSENGDRWFAARRNPQRDVDMRGAGASYQIIETDSASGKPVAIGSIGAGRVWAECHEGAIYLHRGRQFLVRELASDERRVHVRAVRVPYYTRALSEKDTEVLSRDRARPVGNFRLVQGRVRVTTTITGFERRRVHGQDLLDTEPLDLPPTSFETVGLWLEMPDEVLAAVRAEGGHPMGSIHAVEHAALALFPLFVLCDRHDVAGISYVRHPQLGVTTVFLYDAHPGGVGLADSLFDRIESLLEATLRLIDDCDCEDGCPGCVHSPKCGAGNRPIDKTAAARVLRLLLAHEPLPALAQKAEAAEPPAAARNESPALASQPAAHVLYFDLETQRSAADVGGWQNAHLMRIALAVVWDSATQRFETFFERDVGALIGRLRAADLVVGFNVCRFDYQVLRGYTDEDLMTLPTFDMLEAIRERIGFRLALGHLAQETLGEPKSADGLQSLRWWKEGRLDEIESYCRKDVALLRDLLAHAEREGHLLFRTKAGERVRLPARWSEASLLESVHAARAARGEPGRPAPRWGGRP